MDHILFKAFVWRWAQGNDMMHVGLHMMVCRRRAAVLTSRGGCSAAVLTSGAGRSPSRSCADQERCWSGGCREVSTVLVVPDHVGVWRGGCCRWSSSGAARYAAVFSDFAVCRGQESLCGFCCVDSARGKTNFILEDGRGGDVRVPDLCSKNPRMQFKLKTSGPAPAPSQISARRCRVRDTRKIVFARATMVFWWSDS